jgi:hypothetical protein
MTSRELFIASYIECALWSSSNDEGESLDQIYDATDIAPESKAKMIQDCVDFFECAEVSELLDDAFFEGYHTEQAGHDFWLTRNRHGAGFWDRGIGELGDKLTTIAQGFGSSDLMVGDDNLLYIG